IGLLEGATHWSLVTVGDGVVGPGVPVVAFAQIVPLILLAAAVGGLVGFAYRDSRVVARASALQQALSQADRRSAFTRRLPPPASSIFAAGLLALLLSGFFASAFETFVAF